MSNDGNRDSLADFVGAGVRSKRVTKGVLWVLGLAFAATAKILGAALLDIEKRTLSQAERITKVEQLQDDVKGTVDLIDDAVLARGHDEEAFYRDLLRSQLPRGAPAARVEALNKSFDAELRDGYQPRVAFYRVMGWGKPPER
jgi:hypothetical protein